MKTIEEQVRILAEHSDHSGGDIDQRRSPRRWVTGASAALLAAAVGGFVLVQSDDPRQASAPVTTSTPGPSPQPSSIPTLETFLTWNDDVGRWTIPLGSSDGVTEGLALVDTSGILVGVLDSPTLNSTTVSVLTDPEFELDAFVAVPDPEAPDLSGVSLVEGTVRSTVDGSTVFVASRSDDRIPAGLVVATAGGPLSPVHGKLPIATIRERLDDTTTYRLDARAPRELQVRVIIKQLS